MKTEEKAKKVQNIATALAAIFGAVGAFFGIFQAQMSANLKNQVTSLQNASQQTIVNVISTLGDDAQAADLAQSGDTVAITEQLINVYNSTKDQNAALTSETQTLRSENAALQEQVENLKSVLLNTYSMDEIDTVVAQGYLDEVETKRLDNLELLDSERCEQVASVRDLYGTTHSVWKRSKDRKRIQDIGGQNQNAFKWNVRFQKNNCTNKKESRYKHGIHCRPATFYVSSSGNSWYSYSMRAISRRLCVSEQ